MNFKNVTGAGRAFSKAYSVYGKRGVGAGRKCIFFIIFYCIE
jgi:hypothetical protein